MAIAARHPGARARLRSSRRRLEPANRKPARRNPDRGAGPPTAHLASERARHPPTRVGHCARAAGRRASESIDDSDLDARRKIAQQQRNFAAYSERYLGDSRHAGQLIAQLSETVRSMSGSQGAWQMNHLAEQYQASGQWELAELT